jgi:YidC/Oxa1 family membrane protein insertase
VWPLAQKQIMHGRQMMQLQPRIKEIQEKYKDKKTGQTKDPAAFQAETMGIYKEYGINPAAGCLPAFIQMPLFLAVYQSMHHYKFEFTKGTFLWVNELSSKFMGIPLGANLGERDYILVFIYMLSMISTTLLMPVNDPSNAKQQKLMGVGIAFVFSIFMFFYTLPSAFVLYWIFMNILSTAQSLLSYRLPVPELKKTQTQAGGKVIDTSSSSNGHAIGEISPDFFGKKGTPKANKQRKRKK